MMDTLEVLGVAVGLRYPIRDFTSWWQGTLNEATSPTVAIRAEGSYLVFINYND